MTARRAATMLYVVHWPTERIVKIGTTGHLARVRRFTDTGAVVLALVQGRSVADERRALAAVGEVHTRAFERPEHSAHLLGSRGSGYSECFTVSDSGLPVVLDAVLGALARG